MAEVSKDDQINSASAVEIFTVPSNAVLIIASLTVKDESGANSTIDVHLDNGGAAAATTNRVDTIELEANESRSVGQLQGKRIAQGGKLYIDPNGSATNYFLSGRTVVQSTDAEDVG